MQEHILYILVKLLSFIFNLLPLKVALFIARMLGRFVYLINKKRRSIAYAGLKACFDDELSHRDRKHIVKGVYMNLVQSFIEIMRFPKIDEAYRNKYVKIEGRENLDQAMSLKKGTLALAAHFGNWELLALSGSMLGYPVHILAREQKLSRLNTLLNSYRQMQGAKVVAKGVSLKEIFKGLKGNSLVGILADQDAGKNGVFVNYFNRLTSTPRGAFEFAYRLGSILVPVFMVRVNGPYHKVIFEKPINIDRGVDKEQAVKQTFQEFAKLLESYVRKYPSQWLWLHKRWKSCPDRRVLVLSDGKQGHLNQSLAILKQIRKAHYERFQGKGKFEVETIKVEYKNKVARFIFGLSMRFFSSFMQGNLNLFRFAFTKDSFTKISNCYADIIVSSGSSLAALNLALKVENNAKSVVLMRPSLVGLKRFNLAIVPAHDSVENLSNVLRTLITPNLIDEDYLAKCSIALKNRIKQHDGSFKVGLLLGGNSKRGVLQRELVKQVITKIKEISLKLNTQVLVTTSRRTSTDIEKLVEEELGNFENCGLAVIANKENPPEALGAILGLSDVIVVSSDSISMISEAVASKKSVAIFKSSNINNSGKPKEETLVDKLLEKDVVCCSKPEELPTILDDLLNKRRTLKKFDQADEIYENILGRLF